MLDTKTTIHEKIIGDMFVSDTFQAFVYEFCDWADIEREVYGEIMRNIFGNIGVYRKFIAYCGENNFSFLPQEQRESWRLIISLLAFEQACQGVKITTLDSLNDILGIPEKGLELEKSQECIPGTTVSFWRGLQASLYLKIPVNSKGQVIYMIQKVDEIYEVFSYEAGIHFVDSEGVITTLEQQNKAKRILLLKKIEVYQNVVRDTTLQDVAVEELKNLFLQEKNITWDERFETQIRFRSWLAEKLFDMRKDFHELTRQDPRNPQISIVRGSFVED